MANAVSAAEQPCPRAPVEREHRAGQPRPPLHVEDLQRLADLPVRRVLVVEPFRLRPPEVLAGPPPADLHVVLLARPRRRLLGRDVREVEQPGAHSLGGRIGLGRRHALVLAHLQALGP